MYAELIFAIQDNKLVSIDDVESGLGCNCVCPSCYAPLIARKGEVREHHFAHHTKEDCRKGMESAMFLLIEQILNEKKSIFLPKRLGYIDENGVELREVKSIDFDFVSIERELFLNDKPIIKLEKDEKPLFIEINLSENLKVSRKEKILEIEASSIEINLYDDFRNHYHHTKAILTLLSDLVVREVKNKQWIKNIKYNTRKLTQITPIKEIGKSPRQEAKKNSFSGHEPSYISRINKYLGVNHSTKSKHLEKKIELSIQKYNPRVLIESTIKAYESNRSYFEDHHAIKLKNGYPKSGKHGMFAKADKCYLDKVESANKFNSERNCYDCKYKKYIDRPGYIVCLAKFEMENEKVDEQINLFQK